VSSEGPVIPPRRFPDDGIIPKVVVIVLFNASSHVIALVPILEMLLLAGRLDLSCCFLPRQIVRRNGVWG
jgi:hypothetical protein